MATILIIDTALETAGICLAKDGEVIRSAENARQQDHAAWLQPAIAGIMKESGMALQDLDAVAVSAGPGSYTGLRVGLASAKGLCYTLGKPLILLDTLRLMAGAARAKGLAGRYYCPMIDARRMEVYTALYDEKLHVKIPPRALVLEPDSFDSWLSEAGSIHFFGNGAMKYNDMLKSDHAIYSNFTINACDAVEYTFEMYHNQAFSDLAYAEPMYIKAFYTPGKAKS